MEAVDAVGRGDRSVNMAAWIRWLESSFPDLNVEPIKVAFDDVANFCKSDCGEAWEKAENFSWAKTQPGDAAQPAEECPGCGAEHPKAKGRGRTDLEAEEIAALAKTGKGVARKTGLARRAVGGVVAFDHSKSPSGIAASLANAKMALKQLKLGCRYDVFHDRIIVEGFPMVVGGDSAENLDSLVLLLRDEVLRKYEFDPKSAHMLDALRIECLTHAFDPVLDYLDGLKWDGVPRLDRWLSTYCGADNHAPKSGIR